MYKYDEVIESSLDYFGGDELAAKVFAGKYALQKARTTVKAHIKEGDTLSVRSSKSSRAPQSRVSIFEEILL